MKNISYTKKFDEKGLLLNPITQDSPYLHIGGLDRWARRGHLSKERTKHQVIETWGEVECPIFGHPANALLNIGSQYSTHYKDETGNVKPYTIRKIVKRRTIHHKI